MSRKTSFLISMLAFLVLNISVASAAVINVPADQPTIQAGIDAALPGDVVLLSIHASYDGPGNTNIDFRGKAITVKGARDPRGLVIPVIFCAGTAQGFIFQSGEGRGSILENVKILQGNGGALGGGGILINGASPTIRRVTILNSSSGVAATSGGAIRILNGSPLIRNCRLQNNTAAKDGAGYPPSVDRL